MAGKEAVVILLDVGRSIAEYSSESTVSESPLEQALKVVTLLIQQKLLFQNKQDEMGLVLFGTEETYNQLSDDGYAHITVAKELQKPNLEMIRFVDKIVPEGAHGDFIDALIVALDMIINKIGTKKYQKRIFLLTDAGCSVNADDLDTVATQFEKLDARLNVIGINFDNDSSSEVKKNNEEILKNFCERINGMVVPIDKAVEMMSGFRRKTVALRPAVRTNFEISPLISFPIVSYLKTKPATFPSMKKISVVSQLSVAPSTMQVKLERSYYSIAEVDTEVPAEERIKGYRYGKSIVPFSNLDEDALKYKAVVGMKLIGFTNALNIPRQHFMSTVQAVVADKNDESAQIAMSSLIHALAETGSVAIVRLVKSSRATGPLLGALLPNIKPDFECLYFVELPFVEDMRQYPFASLTVERIRKKYQPSVEQLNVAEQLIKELDLMTASKDEEGEPMEALKCKDTYNPALQYFYQCLEHKALGGHGLPTIDPAISGYINPDPSLFAKARNTLNQFKNAFPLKRTETTEKKERRYWSDRWINEGEIKLDSYAPDAKRQKKKSGQKISMASLVSGGTYDVGSINPAQDFQDMLNRRDVDLVDKAILQMRERILQLVNDSVRMQLYPKAMECFRVLRQGCIQEEESDKFNTFLKEVRSFYEGKRRNDFWKLVVEAAITLISSDESDESHITPEEADEFLTTPSVTEVDSSAKDTDAEASADDLFDMLE